MTDIIKKTLKDSVIARWTMLLLVSVTMFAIYFFDSVLAPIQTVLERDLGWSPATYGTVSGSVYMLNILGFIILAGIILDRIGARKSTLIAGVLVIVGAAIKYYGMTDYFINGGFGHAFFDSFWTAFPPSAKVAVIGFAIFGCGLEMACIAVMRAIIHWFKGKEIALALAVQVSIARMGMATVFFFAPRWAGRNCLCEIAGDADACPPFDCIAQTICISTPVAISALLLLVGLLTACIYFMMDVKLDRQDQSETTPSDSVSADDEQFRFSDLKQIFTSKTFFIVAGLCVFFYMSIFSFQRFAVGMLDSRLVDMPIATSDMFALFPFGAVLLTPILGYVLDFRGYGATMLIWGSLLMMTCHAIFAFMPDAMFTFPVALAAIVLLGVSFSLVPAALWPAIPKIVEHRMLGSAIAVVFWIQNIGLMAAPILIGHVLVATNPGIDVVAGETYNYKVPMLIFASFGVLALLLAIWLKHEDKKHGYGLELPNRK